MRQQTLNYEIAQESIIRDGLQTELSPPPGAPMRPKVTIEDQSNMDTSMDTFMDDDPGDVTFSAGQDLMREMESRSRNEDFNDHFDPLLQSASNELDRISMFFSLDMMKHAIY